MDDQIRGATRGNDRPGPALLDGGLMVKAERRWRTRRLITWAYNAEAYAQGQVWSCGHQHGSPLQARSCGLEWMGLMGLERRESAQRRPLERRAGNLSSSRRRRTD